MTDEPAKRLQVLCGMGGDGGVEVHKRMQVATAGVGIGFGPATLCHALLCIDGRLYDWCKQIKRAVVVSGYGHCAECLSEEGKRDR